jgi:hypothetical protein
VTDQGLREQAAAAYIYGFPLVFDLEQVHRFVTTGIGATPATPFNAFGHARALAGPADTFVTINNDTLYSIAQIDLGVGPVVLHVPDAAGRYYVLQFVDAWTNNFAYIGHRSTGTGAGDFLLVPPGWDGVAPDGTTVIRFPTRIGSIVGRWACSGTDDLRAVHLLQDALSLRPLDPNAVAAGLPDIDPRIPDDLAFLEELRVGSQAFPPAGRDMAVAASLAATGIGAIGESPYVDADPAFAAALRDGLEVGRQRLDTILTSGASPEVNGWKLTLHAFDYNLDFFEIGALDDERFKIADPKLRIAERAAAAKGGLWGNHAYEAAYLMTYVDDRGEQLTGERTYTLHLDPTPPVGAFWSLTMYSVPDFYLVANEIDRYSIGDRTPHLAYGEDGSLTITIGADRPADWTAAANWLPAPRGTFRPVLRMYEPAPAVLDGTYVVPAITRT